MTDRDSDRRVLLASGLMVGATLLTAADTILVRVLTEDLHPFEIAFFRAAFGLLFVSPWLLRNRSVLRTHYSWLHVIRAAIKLFALVAFFAAIAAASLADVTAIAFTTPIFVTLGAWFYLDERPTVRRILAVAIGFVGVLIVLRPGQGTISTALLFALTGAVLVAVIQLMLKKMSARDPTDTLVAWNLLLTVPLAAIPAWWVWGSPSWRQLALLALQGAVGALSMTLITRAMSLAKASHLAPLDFLRLPTVAVLAYLFFGEETVSSTWIGAGIIFASALILTGKLRLRGTLGRYH